MKILFVTDFYYPHIGGVEKLFKSLAERLVSEGHKILFITWRYDKNLIRKENVNGVDIIRIPSFSRALFSLIALPSILTYSRKYDLIHTSTYSSAVGAWIASKFNRRKIIITVHEVWGKLWLKLPYLSMVVKYAFMLFEKWLLKLKFSRYIAVSESTKAELLKQGINAGKIEVIYNGIDYNMPQWKEVNAPFTFTFFGRGGVSKGLDLLIESAHLLLEEYPEVKFKFIISPQIKNIFKRFLKEINSGKLKDSSAVFSNLPYLQLVNELITSSCIVIPSYSEGFGFTAVEAYAMGIPIISSGKGALAEVVSGKVIIMEGQSTLYLKEAMKRALNDDYEILPEKKFTINDCVKKHINLYSNIIK